MACRLTRLRVDEVSAVDKGANKKRFLILKQANPDQGSREKAGTPGRGNGGTEMLKLEDVKKAVTEAAGEILAPFDERLSALEASLAKPAIESTAVAKVDDTAPAAEELTFDSITKMVADGVSEAIKPLADRIGKIEDASGERQSAIDEHGAHKVEKGAGGFWEGSGLLV